MDRGTRLTPSFELSTAGKGSSLEWPDEFYWHEMANIGQDPYQFHGMNVHERGAIPVDQASMLDAPYSSQDASTPEKEATESVERRAKRQDQNRKAQKAFRARKEDQLRALERKLAEGRSKIEGLEIEVADLKVALNESRVQVDTLKSTLTSVVSNAITERRRSADTSYDQDSKLLTLNVDLRGVLQSPNSSLITSPAQESVFSCDSAVHLSSILDRPTGTEPFI